MNRLKNIGGKMAAFGAVVATLGLSKAQAAFISYDAQTQAVTFDPAAAIAPIMTGIVAAVLAGTAAFVVFRGVKWIYKILGGSK